MRSISADAIGRSVFVSAAATLRDSRPGASFIWSVCVFDTEMEEILFERTYADPLILLPESGELSPTFEDIVDLPLAPGSYNLQVRLYHLPPGLGAELIQDAELAHRFVGPLGNVEITLGD